MSSLLRNSTLETVFRPIPTNLYYLCSILNNLAPIKKARGKFIWGVEGYCTEAWPSRRWLDALRLSVTYLANSFHELLWPIPPGRNYICPPPLPPFLAVRHFSGEGGGGVYFEAPRGRNFIPPPPPLVIPPPLDFFEISKFLRSSFPYISPLSPVSFHYKCRSYLVLSVVTEASVFKMTREECLLA